MIKFSTQQAHCCKRSDQNTKKAPAAKRVRFDDNKTIETEIDIDSALVSNDNSSLAITHSAENIKESKVGLFTENNTGNKENLKLSQLNLLRENAKVINDKCKKFFHNTSPNKPISFLNRSKSLDNFNHNITQKTSEIDINADRQSKPFKKSLSLDNIYNSTNQSKPANELDYVLFYRERPYSAVKFFSYYSLDKIKIIEDPCNIDQNYIKEIATNTFFLIDKNLQFTYYGIQTPDEALRKLVTQDKLLLKIETFINLTFFLIKNEMVGNSSFAHSNFFKNNLLCLSAKLCKKLPFEIEAHHYCPKSLPQINIENPMLDCGIPNNLLHLELNVLDSQNNPFSKKIIIYYALNITLKMNHYI